MNVSNKISNHKKLLISHLSMYNLWKLTALLQNIVLL